MKVHNLPGHDLLTLNVLLTFRQAVNEKADRVAKCTEQVCNTLVEETLSADIALLVEDVLDIELQRIHKYIKR